MQHSPEYAEFVQKVMPIFGGQFELAHLEIDFAPDQLKAALESPCTQTPVFHVARDQGANYLKWWKDDAPKHLKFVASKIRGLWASYSYEDP